MDLLSLAKPFLKKFEKKLKKFLCPMDLSVSQAFLNFFLNENISMSYGSKP